MLLSGRLTVISDQSATLQTSKVTGDIRVPMATSAATSGVDHPRARTYVQVGVVHAKHLGGPLPFIAARPQSNCMDDRSWWELPHSDSIDRVLGNFFSFPYYIV